MGIIIIILFFFIATVLGRLNDSSYNRGFQPIKSDKEIPKPQNMRTGLEKKETKKRENPY